jgi:signal transduction histidine kinase
MTRIFERFQKINREDVKGTGLGLMIVKHIIELHGGIVWGRIIPEGGSMFYVEIRK